jgi:hypothetical protein
MSDFKPDWTHRLRRLTALTALLTGTLVPCSAGGALAACPGVCDAESASTGLAFPPAWAAGRHLHFEPSSGAVSSYTGAASLSGGAQAELSGSGEEVEGEGPLLYNPNGRGVQHNPKVYPIFWGSNWNEPPGAELRASLLDLFEGLSGSAYQGVLTQYFDSTGRISSQVTVTPYTDTSVPAPSSVNAADVEEEVNAAIKANDWPREFDDQFEILTAPGSTYEEGFVTGFCSYHGATRGEAAYTFVPYQGDPPFNNPEGCLSTDQEHNPAHKTMKSASHEYAESATNPIPGFKSGTSSWNASDGAEVADICQTEFDLELPDGAWAQNLYDDHQNQCTHEDLEAAHVYAITEPASDVGPVAAKVNGILNPEDLDTKYHFEYGTTPAYGSVTREARVRAGVKDKNATQTLAHLQGETTYHYRLVASNSSGTSDGLEHVFTTLGAQGPAASTEAATAVTKTAATLNAVLDPNGSKTTYHFEYGTTTAYGTSVPVPSGRAGAGMKNVHKSETIHGLEADTPYHFRIVATNGVGTVNGEDRTFTTASSASARAEGASR